MRAIEIPATLLVDPEAISQLIRDSLPGLKEAKEKAAAAELEPSDGKTVLRLKISEGASPDQQGRQVIEQTLEQAHGIKPQWSEMDTSAIRVMKSLFPSVSLQTLASTIASMPISMLKGPVCTWIPEAFKLAAINSTTSAAPAETPTVTNPVTTNTGVPEKRKRGRPKNPPKVAAAPVVEAPPEVPAATTCDICGGVLPTHLGNCPARPIREAGQGGAIPARVANPTVQPHPSTTAAAAVTAPTTPAGGPGFEVCKKNGVSCPLPHRPVIFEGARVAGHSLADLALLRVEMGLAPAEIPPGVSPRMTLPPPPNRSRGKKKGGRARR